MGVPVKRFMVFAFNCYYPSGGWRDFISAHENIEDARKVAERAVGPDDWDSDDITGKDYAQIVDAETMATVQTLNYADSMR
jgi:hypothetical protein